VPVPAEFGIVLGNHHQVAFSHLEPALTTRAQVTLACRVGLDQGGDLYAERAAHSTNRTVTRMVPATMRTSTAVIRLWRNGLNPTGSC